MYLCKFNQRIIQVKIQSRHVSSKVYKIWIEYDELEGTIDGWYCTCKSGARTLGCCSHITSVLWYLGYYRHCQKKQRNCQSYKDFLCDAEDSEEIDQQDDWSDNYDSSSEDDSDDEDK